MQHSVERMSNRMQATSSPWMASACRPTTKSSNRHQVAPRNLSKRPHTAVVRDKFLLNLNLNSTLETHSIQSSLDKRLAQLEARIDTVWA